MKIIMKNYGIIIGRQFDTITTESRENAELYFREKYNLCDKYINISNMDDTYSVRRAKERKFGELQLTILDNELQYRLYRHGVDEYMLDKGRVMSYNLDELDAVLSKIKDIKAKYEYWMENLRDKDFGNYYENKKNELANYILN